jgi:hypothetical protein
MDECTEGFHGGSKEQTMTNLSFARIMYGTSEDSQGSMNTTATALSAASAAANHGIDQTADEPDALGELLHRAWTILSRKS